MSDVDGDGVFTFDTEAIPPGSYEFKIATNESWSNPNYGQDGGSEQRAVYRAGRQLPGHVQL